MQKEYLGFRLCNLLIPGDPVSIDFTTESGTWELRQDPNYNDAKAKINNGQIAETYTISIIFNIGSAGISASVDAVFEELLPICLAATYLTASSVSPTRSLPMSFLTVMTVGSHFPRPRAVAAAMPVISNDVEFRSRVEAFVHSYPSTSQTEKSRLLVHHMLDGLACWSLEDLCLSAATLLEIVAATAKVAATSAGLTKITFSERIDYAAQRFAIPTVSSDFRDMRNDLVHEGTLSGTKFQNKTADDCAAAAASALEWIDKYIHSAFNLGPVVVNRFPASAYQGLNAFSID
jgi:hypothetical protein